MCLTPCHIETASNKLRKNYDSYIKTFDVTYQNQRIRYIFSLMIFWVRTHKPLLVVSPPAAPTIGRSQDTSVGNAAHIGFLEKTTL